MGADGRRAAAQRARAAGGFLFCVRFGRRSHRQGRRYTGCTADRRRALGVIRGLGGTAALALAGYYNTAFLDGVPLMVVLLCASTFFIEGGFSNLAPYSVESYGVNLGARSSGLGRTANGFGKIIGPLSLALIAGTSHLVSPEQ